MSPSENIAKLTEHLTAHRRARIAQRLHDDQIAWLSTVRPDGRPETVAVWFLLLEDGTLVVYSQPNKVKLRNIATNPNVALALDDSDLGRDVVRIEGTARYDATVSPLDELPAYVAKYAERIDLLFGTPRAFADMFSEPIVITPTRVHSIDSEI
ncbi:TIGR03667 family PPOX class F420-dependent oxidoreductase [Nocardia sp. 2]|uniref:TIGR03667 family PPOX class F420-dependent oxidoreductase n=1 Tax=Nocardia acididurans TaxID=2802282 RepID=A0ABS1M0R8_9NOCA|nr:TIGR03667 family PPOX class F420-dependent oxidoreductase [Nocardia acididurans]MBL1073650.1 TIGR03667 family PPOX class F420-dependent oxidoreductase [Nocardia acididurans]